MPLALGRRSAEMSVACTPRRTHCARLRRTTRWPARDRPSSRIIRRSAGSRLHPYPVSGRRHRRCSRKRCAGRGAHLARAARRPAAGDLVLVADTSFICEPDFYRVDAALLLTRDGVQAPRKLYETRRSRPRLARNGAAVRRACDSPWRDSPRLSFCLAITTRKIPMARCAPLPITIDRGFSASDRAPLRRNVSDERSNTNAWEELLARSTGRRGLSAAITGHWPGLGHKSDVRRRQRSSHVTAGRTLNSSRTTHSSTEKKTRPNKATAAKLLSCAANY